MALKDIFNNMVNYFDTEEASEVEEEVTEALRAQASQSEAVRSAARPRQSQASQPKQTTRTEQVAARPASRPQAAPASAQVNNYQASGENMSTLRSRQEQFAAQSNPQSNRTTIALKYPKKYEDATEIVDLLIENECVLIDFQYMLDAQARRCLDFVDGASRVLSGNLQKVGASMYLLTPINVIVDVEEMGLQNAGQDINFDFDMKRR
ncbi:cell division protein SepF [Streptococcus loxodontisalivarius]|uniref:Cell division protein SepF n=1 Tax=Streptococcus loxodontisalivarius TaxID=1349415 RepID=A0ABS2PRF3_9STRE|nr:cell division protein SepF [Streptococcus loxodontisalivarius]MBM7642617.1 cell division inhibitor SepF [Streptococcus loxodontisalivarius]